jgi:hypothetical protein
MTLTNKNCIQEEIASRLNAKNTCCHAGQYILSSFYPYKNGRNKIYKTIIMDVKIGLPVEGRA